MTITQITTVEELDALPVNTIVMDAHRRGFQKFTNGWEPTGLGKAYSEVARPVTVLYKPVVPEKGEGDV